MAASAFYGSLPFSIGPNWAVQLEYYLFILVMRDHFIPALNKVSGYWLKGLIALLEYPGVAPGFILILLLIRAPAWSAKSQLTGHPQQRLMSLLIYQLMTEAYDLVSSEWVLDKIFDLLEIRNPGQSWMGTSSTFRLKGSFIISSANLLKKFSQHYCNWS